LTRGMPRIWDLGQRSQPATLRFTSACVRGRQPVRIVLVA
jgi:hypothetical protein